MGDSSRYWAETINTLQLQLTRNQFDGLLLRSSSVISERDGTWQIGVASAMIAERLTFQLKPVVERTLTGVAGRSIKLEFVARLPVDPPPPIDDQPEVSVIEELEPAPVQSVADLVQMIDWRPLRDKSYTAVGNYGLAYWQPWLNQQSSRSYQLWLSLQVGDTRPTFEKNFGNNWWTPPVIHRLRELSGTIGSRANTPTLTGRMADCAACAHAIDTGNPLEACCRAWSPTVWQSVGPDQAMCRHWTYGSLQCLQDAALLAVNVNEGSTNSHQLELQVWRQLPILTPRQVADLPDLIQAGHDQWLSRYGLQTLGLTIDAWREIDASNLVPLLPGHQEHRRLGRYEWNKIIREGLRDDR